MLSFAKPNLKEVNFSCQNIKACKGWLKDCLTDASTPSSSRRLCVTRRASRPNSTPLLPWQLSKKPQGWIEGGEGDYEESRWPDSDNHGRRGGDVRGWCAMVSG